MKAVFLNTWAGKAGLPLINFIKKNSLDTELLILQEVTSPLLDKLKKTLRNWEFIYEKGNTFNGVDYGQAVFVRKPLKIVESGKISLFKISEDGFGDIGFLQTVRLETPKGTLFVGNVQGKTWPGDKLDTKERLEQSKIIIETFKDKNTKYPVIIGGDFNLMPNTKSVGMIEGSGYKNLIKDFKIKTTRNKLAWDYFMKSKKDKYFGKQLFADYVFVNGKVSAIRFLVPNTEISDHLPMILEFDL